MFYAQSEREFAELQSQVGDGALAVAQASVELAFAQSENVRADLEGLLLVGGRALPWAAMLFVSLMNLGSWRRRERSSRFLNWVARIFLGSSCSSNSRLAAALSSGVLVESFM